MKTVYSNNDYIKLGDRIRKDTSNISEHDLEILQRALSQLKIYAPISKEEWEEWEGGQKQGPPPAAKPLARPLEEWSPLPQGPARQVEVSHWVTLEGVRAQLDNAGRAVT